MHTIYSGRKKHRFSPVHYRLLKFVLITGLAVGLLYCAGAPLQSLQPDSTYFPNRHH